MIHVGVVPANKVLFAGTVPANNLFLNINILDKKIVEYKKEN